MFANQKKGKKGKKGVLAHQHDSCNSVVPAGAVQSTLTSMSTHIISAPVDAATREQILQLSLRASISRGQFENVKFYAFSRRARTGVVDTPLPLFGEANLIRKASEHFNLVLTSSGFTESGITDLDAFFPSTRTPYAEQYDYLSDSDLEDESEDESSMSTMAAVNALDDQDDFLEDDHDTEGLRDKEKDIVADSQKNAKSEPEGSSNALVQRLARRQGRVVFIEDIAYKTLETFIFYAYLEEVPFAPLRSQEQPVIKKNATWDPPSCSPKSMYRLAQKYGIETLKKLAADDIKSKLTARNILPELFSSLTRLHPEIHAIEIDYLHNHIEDPTLLSLLPQWFQYLERGQLPDGAATVFSNLVLKLAQLEGKKCRVGCNAGMRCNNCGNFVD